MITSFLESLFAYFRTKPCGIWKGGEVSATGWGRLKNTENHSSFYPWFFDPKLCSFILFDLMLKLKLLQRDLAPKSPSPGLIELIFKI